MRRSVLLCALLLATPLFAGEAADIVSIKGYESGGIFTLEIVPGAAATEAIRVYSEPSHTLLTVVEDADFAETEPGKYWHSQVFAENPRSASKTRLPEGRPRMQLAPRPATDDRIVAWVYGSWQDGKVEDRKAGEKTVGSGAFEMSLSSPSGALAFSARRAL